MLLQCFEHVGPDLLKELLQKFFQATQLSNRSVFVCQEDQILVARICFIKRSKQLSFFHTNYVPVKARK